MTVPSTTTRVTYAGDGLSTAFPVSFYFLANADLVVLLVDSDGNSTTQVLTTNYTVAGAGVEAGGTVTMLVAPPSGYTLVIYRDPAVTQLTDYQPNDPFPAETHERALDKLTMIAQRARELVTRSFRLADSDTSGASTTLPTPTPNNIIGWDNTGAGLANYTAADFATLATAGNYTRDVFSGNGVTTMFTLSVSPGSINNTQVNVGGVYQLKKDYSLVGTTLTFASAPPSGTNNIEVITAGAVAIGTPSDGSVSTAQIADGAVTTPKLGDVSVSTAKIIDDAVTYAKLQNLTTNGLLLGRNTAGAGNVEELSLSQVLDFIGSAAQGDILYRAAVGWARLAAGTSGQFLKTLGAGQNPSWSGSVDGELFFRLDADLAGANVSTAQNALGVGVTLAASTVYEFEAVMTFVKSAGTTSHNFSLQFGGTATVNNIAYDMFDVGTNSTTVTSIASNLSVVTTAGSATIASGITSAARAEAVIMRGTISVNAGGTLIPQYILSAAPGGAYTTKQGAFFRLRRIGAAGANINVGSWS